MGQEVAVTPLQMVMAMSAIANDGWLMSPMIVNRLERRDGSLVQQYAPKRNRQVVTENTTRQMIEALKTVVTKDGSLSAQFEHTVAVTANGVCVLTQRPDEGGMLRRGDLV